MQTAVKRLLIRRYIERRTPIFRLLAPKDARGFAVIGGAL
jgi:hypothetical protein